MAFDDEYESDGGSVYELLQAGVRLPHEYEALEARAERAEIERDFARGIILEHMSSEADKQRESGQAKTRHLRAM